MTAQNINTTLLYPATSISSTGLTMDAAGEKVAFNIQIPKTGNVSVVYARIGTVTSAQTLNGSFQAIDLSTGFPDGTPIQSGTHASPASNTWATFTLGTDYSATRGDFVSFVIGWDSTAGNLTILSDNVFRSHVSIANLYTTSWAKQARGSLVILEYDDGSFEFMPGAAPGVASTYIFNSGSTPDEYALRFSLPVPVTCRGIIGNFRIAGDCDFVLYSGTTALQTVSADPQLVENTASTTMTMLLFDADEDLSANTVYYLSQKPTTTTDCRVGYYEVNTNAWLAQLEGGIECYLATRTNAGAWSTNTAVRPQIGLLVSKLDDGAGGGGGLAANPIRGFVG